MTVPKSSADHRPASDDKSSAGLRRRTVVKGAAWSIPVIAVAVATPLAAASVVGLLLDFTRPSYTVAVCDVLSGVQVRVTTWGGSVVAPGQTVTVTLDDGYTFTDGSTTYTGVSDASGLVTLPGISAPPAGGNGTFTATSGAFTGTVPVTTPIPPDPAAGC